VTSTACQSVEPTAPRRRWWRWVLRALIGLLALLIAGELFARFYLGLGDPPLSMFDADMEYRAKPSMTYRRFGNHIHYNAYSMRSEDFPAHKSSPDELRVMVFGDSVINGGAPTDDSQLATKLLEKELSRDLHRPVIVGNISAASWGPPNQLAYAKKFGLFDADVVVIVLSSHDYADSPDFMPVVDVDSDFPGHRPWCALQEGFSRYLLHRYVHFRSNAPAAKSGAALQKDIDTCSLALRDLIALAKARGAKVIVAQHLESTEFPGHEKPGHAVIEDIVKQAGVPDVQFGPAFHASRRAKKDPWRDNIHPNATGQRLMADLLKPEIEMLVRQPATRP
jgi:hypothetical protein